MDTKSKSFSRRMPVRVMVFLLCIIMFTSCIMLAFALEENVRIVNSYEVGLSMEDILFMREYEESDGHQARVDENFFLLLHVIEEYKSEQYIKSGATIDEDDLYDVLADMYEQVYIDRGQVIIDGRGYAIEGHSQEFSFMLPAEDEANRTPVDIARERAIAKELEDFRAEKRHLDSTKGYSYYVTDGSNVFTNMQLTEGQEVKASDFSADPAYLLYENGELTQSPQSKNTQTYRAAITRTADTYLDGGENLKLYFSFDEKYIAQASQDYNQVRDEVAGKLPAIIVLAILTLISFIWLAVTTGGKDSEGKRKLYRIDKLYTEVQLFAVMATLFIGLFFCSNFSYYAIGYYSYMGNSYVYTSGSTSLLQYMLVSAMTVLIAAVGLWFVLGCIRLIKGRSFIKNSLIYKLGSALIKVITEVINGGSMMRKAMIVTLAICLLSMTIFLAPVVFIAILLFVPIWARKYDEIQKGVNEVKSGNLAYKIPVDEDKKVAELSQLARGINEISEASSIAIQNELKNQRMKTDLISNVSHDLKTPLTSMVSYIDLLKTEGLESPNAPEYLDILDKKTERLTKLTEDLFEAAKASSGAMPVNLEKVDLLSLLNQSLGEMSNNIEASGLDFIINAPNEKYPVMADGRVLWRVIENLIGNALKYSQEASRVYVEIKETRGAGGASLSKDKAGNFVILEIKNMSRQALNIDPDELMERFTRGDEARFTEGSGLGLAITKDLVKLMGGWLEISIDGDLFKVQVLLNRASEGQE